ncbi:hypothetical protein [Ammoniphilus resinae]|uniref:Uncharacterized protein n=1 Tax=Ammoniphilus resinae TaxID=861532 RepID=A0ABS4GNC0_9BACL|nr:hypothetical protein [Ammoniphilus resinae]MBP1931763.1 hypothetical protein [Ammoniphilus resinae]
MSYSIEYNRAIYKDDEGFMMLFIKQGDNNVWESDNKQRARDWSLVEHGSEKELWKYLGSRAGYTMGGGLQRAAGWTDTKSMEIEEYIKIYRSKIKNAKPLERVLEDFSISLVIYKRDVIADSELETKILTVIDHYGLTSYGSHYYDREKKKYRYSISSVGELRNLLQQLPPSWTDDATVRYEISARKSRI